MSATSPLRRALELVYIVDERASADDPHLDQVFDAGVTSLWLRAHALTDAQLFEIAERLLARCRARNVSLIIGGRADVARAVGADGVQLGFRSPPAERVRDGFPGWIGVSCHDATELVRAQAARADYVMLSPVYDVPGKGPPLGLETFGQLCETVALPVVALGGIDASNAAHVRAHGACGVAVIRALRDAPDPQAVARALRAKPEVAPDA